MADSVGACPLFAQLSERERQFFLLFLEGGAMKEISSRMGIDPRTTSQIKARTMRKLEVATEVAMVLYAVRAGLVPSAARTPLA